MTNEEILDVNEPSDLVQCLVEAKDWNGKWVPVMGERGLAKAVRYLFGQPRHTLVADGCHLVEFTTSEINELQSLGIFKRETSTGRFRVVAEMP